MALVTACGGGGGGNSTTPASPNKSAAKTLASFSIVTPNTQGIINEASKLITINITESVDVKKLVAKFSTTGVSVKIGEITQVSGTTVNDFSRPVNYTVVAEDGSTETYRVEVIVLVKSSNKAITAFSFPDYQTSAVIDESKKIITATLPANANLASLKARFETNGVDVSVNGVKQVSDVSPIDFSGPVSYKVMAEDGTSQLYIVLISRLVLSSAKEISSFSIPSLGVSGTIDNDMSIISVLVPANTDVSQLTPRFVTTGVVVSVNNVPQQSEKNVQNFTKELKYVVTAEDGSNRTYTVSVSGPSSITLQSDAGDYIGAGRSYAYDKSNTLLSISANGASLSVKVNGDEYWDANLVLPNTFTKFIEGTYTGFVRYPFNSASVGGFTWYGEGRGCNNSTTNVVIKNVRYIGNDLSYIDLKFDQYCENGTSSLHGAIVYNKFDSTKIKGPVNPIPDNLWKPAQTKIPATGNYVYLQSDVGDYIGGGREYLYQGATDRIQVLDGSSIRVVTGNWYGNFMRMNSLPQLTVGYYPDLRRYPFHNPVKGGLDWSGYGRGCNELSGWFAVDNVKYVNGILNELELRFEQHCERGPAALRGKIYWSAQNASSPQIKALTMREELELAKTRAMLIRPAGKK
ncbi:DUF5018 domain-containing protein [Undibacterium curvum]|uniref:DUF5018 domain-containing protein n=1 Tax=Undibacterium curvum TaxID=2762294 RepID=A0ABR6ZZR9_9BURK|nr:hypothetical protein [Undibacterium curvum]MBC3930168.1 hypothetical protein [Undibacterium curvum]